MQIEDWPNPGLRPKNGREPGAQAAFLEFRVLGSLNPKDLLGIAVSQYEVRTNRLTQLD